MVVADGPGIPLATLVESAQVAEVRLAASTLERVPRRRGRPKGRPRCLMADKGYDGQALRQGLRRRGIRPCIPERRGRRPRPGRKVDLSGYRRRWKVERTIAWLGNFRRLVVRWERLPSLYQAFLTVACLLITLDKVLQ
jgi:transposase